MTTAAATTDGRNTVAYARPLVPSAKNEISQPGRRMNTITAVDLIRMAILSKNPKESTVACSYIFLSINFKNTS